MKKPVVILFTITNEASIHTLGVYNLKAYALEKIPYRPLPKIIVKIHKAKNKTYNKNSYFFQLSKKEIDKITGWLLNQDPEVIGFSCWLSNSRATLKIANSVRKKNKRIKLIFGGTETYHNDFYDRKGLMEKERGIDVITRYDGERVFLELLESYIYKKRALSAIEGIAYRENNIIKINRERPPMALDDIPSPYLSRIFRVKVGAKEVLVENSRGCPYRCSYCSFNSGNFGYFRYFPFQRVEKDLLYLFKKNIKFINLLDSNFNVNEKRTKKILKLIIENNKKNIEIGVFYNATKNLISEEMAKLFHLSKIILTIGVQSVNPHALKTANRQTDMKILEKNLTILDKAKVNYALEFIYGLPKDSYADIKDIISWIFRFNAQRVFFYRLCILKGTPFFELSNKLGLVYENRPPFYIVKTPHLSQKEIYKVGRLLESVSFFYNHFFLRKIIYQIQKIFRLRFPDIFEYFIRWKKSPKFKSWTYSYAQDVSNKFVGYLMSQKEINSALQNKT